VAAAGFTGEKRERGRLVRELATLTDARSGEAGKG
jgi:hypothetical protein